jgi:DNA excision repair protein ERCC-4
VLISPTEPAFFRTLGKVSSLPEKHGSDFLIITKSARIGIQRKTITDLLASLHDGRLSKQLAQMQSSNLLSAAVVIIEGVPQWSNESMMMDSQTPFSKSNWWGVLMSLQSIGVITLTSERSSETLSILEHMPRYFSKAHRSLLVRPKPSSSWGTPNTQLTQSHLLQSFAGIGPKTAEAIIDKFGGVPLTWTVSSEQLAEVPGIGKLTARKLQDALDRSVGSAPP